MRFPAKLGTKLPVNSPGLPTIGFLSPWHPKSGVRCHIVRHDDIFGGIVAHLRGRKSDYHRFRYSNANVRDTSRRPVDAWMS